MPRLPRIRTELALATRGKVGGWLDGAHPSINAGRSLEFHDVREYVRGDDTADIDWKASARHGSLLVQQHVAERRTTLLLAVATGRPMAAMASPTVQKRELALDAAATLASLALHAGDYVGLLHWDTTGPVAARPSRRAVRVEQMLTDAERAIDVDASNPELTRLLDVTATSIRRRGIVALIMGDEEVDEGLEVRLRRLAVQHTMLAIVVPDLDPTDPRARGRVFGIDDRRRLPAGILADEALGISWRADVADRARRRTSTLARLAIPSITLRPEDPVVPQLLAWSRSLRHAA